MEHKRSERPDNVFISHASENEPAAERARNALSANGQTVYLAVRDDGRRLASPAAKLNAALERCQRIVVLWSRSAANAVWVSYEWRAFFEHYGSGACDVYALDDTPFPANVEGNLADAPEAWRTAEKNDSHRRHPTPFRAQTPTVFTTWSPGGIDVARRCAAQAERLGYEVVQIGSLPESEARAATFARPGDWILVAAGAEAPRLWELAFGDDPDRYPRRLVVREPDAAVPMLLRQGITADAADSAHVRGWLELPDGRVWRGLFFFSSRDWISMIRRFHDNLDSRLSWRDPRLEFIDPRLRRRLGALRLTAFAYALSSHLVCGLATFFLSLCQKETTRRNLVLDLTMVLFAGIATEQVSLPAAIAMLVYAGGLGPIAVVVSGFFTHAGVPGIAVGAGIALATIAMSESLLAPAKHRRVNRASRAAVSAVIAVAIVACVVVAGLFTLLEVGNVANLSGLSRLVLGLAFGALGGGTVGFALAWIRSYLLRGRDRGKGRETLVRGAFLGAPAAALGTLWASGDPEKLLDGVGVGLYCGALLVALAFAPAAAMRRYTQGPALPFIGSAIAIAVAGLVSLLSNAGLKTWLVPCLVLGTTIGATLLWLPEREGRRSDDQSRPGVPPTC